MSTPPRTTIYPTDYIVDDAGCWIWQLWCDKDGYGMLSANAVRWRSHRFSWVVANGPIPDGMEVDHLCFKPACINPAHLRLLTPLENAINHRATYKTHCANGHEFTPENTKLDKRGDGRTFRRCITCRRASGARARANRRARREQVAA